MIEVLYYYIKALRYLLPTVFAMQVCKKCLEQFVEFFVTIKIQKACRILSPSEIEGGSWMAFFFLKKSTNKNMVNFIKMVVFHDNDTHFVQK